jgi:O-antigen/teichoic acid export membrane protein
MLFLGPWVTALLFGPKLVLSTTGILLVSVGVALFLVALVASDGALAIGRHSLVLRSWLVALVAVVPITVVADGTLLRATIPLIVGASIAALQLVIGLSLGFGRNHREVTLF